MRRRRLGGELRRLREAAGIDVEAAAAELDCSVGKIRHIENGRNAPRKPELTALVNLYGIAEDQHVVFEEIRREAARPGWWSQARLPTWLQTYVGAETDAHTVSTFTLELIPGLLQIEPYARTVHEIEGLVDIDRKVAARVRRQQRLVADEYPLTLNAVISEATLHRVANAPFAKDQFRHLLTMGQRANITVRILPFSAGLHVSLNGGFILLEFDPEVSLTAAYVEYAVGGDLVDDQVVVARMAEKFATLRELAMSEEESAHFIREWI